MDNAGPTEDCPVCGKLVASAKIDAHVNACLDSGGSDLGVVPPAAPAVLSQHQDDNMDEDTISDSDLEVIKSITSAEERIQQQRRREEEENERLFAEWLKKEQEEEEKARAAAQAQREQAEGFRCSKCNQPKEFEQVWFLEACNHYFCRPCLKQFALEKISSLKCSELICFEPACHKPLGASDLKGLLSQKEFETWQENSIKEVISTNPDQFTECPQCHTVIERVALGNVDANKQTVMGPDGKPLSPEAVSHREQHRFRCRHCDTEFCADCHKQPYHIGFTCKQFEDYERAKKCRFCQIQLTKNNQAPLRGWAACLIDVCNSAECTAKRALACPRTLQCGHACSGCNFDDKFNNHPLCINSECIEKAKMANTPYAHQEGEDYCNICWVESLSAAPSLVLECGHMFHFECIKKKVHNKWSGAMITFGFLDCPLCKKQVSHPALREDLKPHLALMADVKDKAMKRLKQINMDDAKELKDQNSPFYQNPEKYAMARFCYYPCFKCQKPYFGGMRECNAEQRVADYNPQELVCGACASVGSEKGNCAKHGSDFIEYKCKFCCNVAAWFCWGNTHFCEDCHKIAGTIAQKPKNELPKCTCSVKHPPNGEEYCLGCSVCRFESDM